MGTNEPFCQIPIRIIRLSGGKSSSNEFFRLHIAKIMDNYQQVIKGQKRLIDRQKRGIKMQKRRTEEITFIN